MDGIAEQLSDQEGRTRPHRREYKTLGDQVTDQSTAADAECETHRDLPPRADGASEQQVRHVEAGDEQNSKGDAGEPPRYLRFVGRARATGGDDRRDDHVGFGVVSILRDHVRTTSPVHRRSLGFRRLDGGTRD